MASGPPGGNWKNAGASRPAAGGGGGGSRRPWQPGGQAKKPPTGQRKSRVGRFILAGLGTAGLLALLVVVILYWRPARYPELVVVGPNPEKSLAVPENSGGLNAATALATWAGEKKISAKKEWPDWTPPPEMLERQPSLPHFMAGGPDNPLGARALYLGSSLYRIHGSNEPWTIGQAVSSGCIRMRNEDVIDIYEKVRIGTKVVVI